MSNEMVCNQLSSNAHLELQHVNNDCQAFQLYKIGNFYIKTPRKWTSEVGNVIPENFTCKIILTLFLWEYWQGFKCLTSDMGNCCMWGILIWKKHGTELAHITTTEILVSWMFSVPVSTYTLSSHLYFFDMLLSNLYLQTRRCYIQVSHGSEHKVYGLVGYDTMKVGKWVPMFQWNLLPPLTSQWRQQIPPKCCNQTANYTAP
jgi:hypothetical protein